MDQFKIGTFLKQLRKERNLTQENLAELLNVSNRTVSRWETGSNMPDISILVEIADLYGVGIPEIINGERKKENMDQETRETAVAMAKYSHNETKNSRKKVIGYLLAAFGIFIIISALAIFPNDSSWGSVYSILGGIILLIGIFLITQNLMQKKWLCILPVTACLLLLISIFSISDYIAVTHLNQVPRFRYQTTYHSNFPNQRIYKTLFYTVIQTNPGKPYAQVRILK